jgi:hypothetical protein
LVETAIRVAMHAAASDSNLQAASSSAAGTASSSPSTRVQKLPGKVSRVSKHWVGWVGWVWMVSVVVLVAAVGLQLLLPAVLRVGELGSETVSVIFNNPSSVLTHVNTSAVGGGMVADMFEKEEFVRRLAQARLDKVPRSTADGDGSRESARPNPEADARPGQVKEAAIREEVEAMRVSEIKSELASKGVSTQGLLEKSDFVKLLVQTRLSVTSLEDEISSVRSMKMAEIKRELSQEGLATDDMFEKEEFVRRLAQARLDKVPRGGVGGQDGRGREGEEEGEGMARGTVSGGSVAEWLHREAADGDVKRVARLLDGEGWRLWVTDGKRRSVLHVAAQSGKR